MDMTAYVKPGTKERIGIIQDFVSPSLTEYVHRLIDEYNDIPSVQTECKYACSDHSSWTKIGVPSAFAIGKLGVHTFSQRGYGYTNFGMANGIPLFTVAMYFCRGDFRRF